MLFTLKPFSSFSPKGFSLEYLLYHRSAPGGGRLQGGSRPAPFPTPPPPTPTHCGVNLHKKALPRGPGMAPKAGSVTHFQGLFGLGRRFSTHHVPRCILQRGEETTRVEKDDKRVELATRTAFNSHPPAARCYDHNMHHIPTEIISAMERHGTGAGPLAEKLRREGSRPD
ncbi:hypothetical protein JTE90_019897 [Oedothorax gibbosus]|uniref:Uncharacterized protein n=1 Tax=Oedothorax gibbosus TaxID=931172 RepID=A0AAV6THQ0_9ARAC|nr:hypothetical protein JTE90_019897 [Oedothorax gibbosus]